MLIGLKFFFFFQDSFLVRYSGPQTRMLSFFGCAPVVPRSKFRPRVRQLLPITDGLSFCGNVDRMICCVFFFGGGVLSSFSRGINFVNFVNFVNFAHFVHFVQFVQFEGGKHNENAATGGSISSRSIFPYGIDTLLGVRNLPIVG